jgi:hypothetical protein
MEWWFIRLLGIGVIIIALGQAERIRRDTNRLDRKPNQWRSRTFAP